MKGQGGFTLVELLVAMLVGSIVILAGLQALDSFSTSSATVAARSDNTQRARLGMDLIVRQLRSQACSGPGGPSVLAGSPTSVTFVTDLGDGTTPPQKRTVTYDAATRRLQEQRFPSIAATSSSSTMTLLKDVGRDAVLPIFEFYAYDTGATPRPDLLLPSASGLSAADRARVARITVAFRVGPPAGTRTAGVGATLADEVFLRSVTPSDPAPLPLCP